MEPSSTDELSYELITTLRAARRNESYLPLEVIASLVEESLEPWECKVLANLLQTYDQGATPAEVGA